METEVVVNNCTFDQKNGEDLLRADFALLLELKEAICPELPLSRIIVDADFDGAVRRFKGEADDYTWHRREHFVMGKTIPSFSETVIVFNPALFSIIHDQQTRHLLYIHELFHAIFANSILEQDEAIFRDLYVDWDYEISQFDNLEFQDLQNLTALYDEYYAHRHSLSIMDSIYKQKTKEYRKNYYVTIKGHLSDFTNIKWYVQIKREFADYQQHMDFRQYAKGTAEAVEVISKSLIYFLSFADHHPRAVFFRKALLKSKFWNQRTRALTTFIRKKYETNKYSLRKGMPLMRKFFLNFGQYYHYDQWGSNLTPVDID